MFWELAADTWGQEERTAIERVVDSGQYTIGPQVEAFESAFADYHGSKYAIMVNSGSSANLISVASLFYVKKKPLLPGDEVIVPAVSWSTTYHPLQQYGLKLRFVDVELDTLNIDILQLENALSPRTRAVFAVSILGNPAALDKIRSFADLHGLYMLEDNCESLDAEIGNKKAGTFGDISTFSFFFSHHISTGEGGMVLTNSTEINGLCRAIRAHGWVRDVPKDAELFSYGDDTFAEAYRFVIPGYNVRPQEINAAVGLEQLKKLPKMTAQRRANLKLFQDCFSDHKKFIIQRENGKSSSFCFPMIVRPDSGLDRSDIFSPLKGADIGFRMITGGSFPRHDAIKYFDYDIVGDLANSDIIHDQGFFVGNHPYDLTHQIYKLYEILNAL
jgi:CDP-6-deoxy-D-xylo-4-hexulose-3-dehydrase